MPDITVTRSIAAPAERVWDLVSDVTRMGEWSPENVGGVWKGGATGPVVGARFTGRNRKGWRRWSTSCTVTRAERGVAFAFRVTSGPVKVATWAYELEPRADGCVVTETWTDERGPVVPFLGKLLSGVGDRATHNRVGMEATLAGLAAVAESAPNGG